MKKTLTFHELFLWALDNQIGLQVYTKPISYNQRQDKDNQLYCARFDGHNGIDIVGQELLGQSPDNLLHICEIYLDKIYSNMTMKKPRKRND